MSDEHFDNAWHFAYGLAGALMGWLFASPSAAIVYGLFLLTALAAGMHARRRGG